MSNRLKSVLRVFLLVGSGFVIGDSIKTHVALNETRAELRNVEGLLNLSVHIIEENKLIVFPESLEITK